MKFNRHFKTFDLENGVPMLVFFEPEGDDGILHFAVWPDDLGHVDLKLSGPAEGMEAAFDKVDQAGAQQVFDTQIGPMLTEILGDG